MTLMEMENLAIKIIAGMVGEAFKRSIVDKKKEDITNDKIYHDGFIIGISACVTMNKARVWDCRVDWERSLEHLKNKIRNNLNMESEEYKSLLESQSEKLDNTLLKKNWNLLLNGFDKGVKDFTFDDEAWRKAWKSDDYRAWEAREEKNRENV